MRATIPRRRKVVYCALGWACWKTYLGRPEANWARAFYADTGAALGDLREAVSTLEEIESTARRVLGPANPTAAGIEECLQDARVVENVRVRRAAADALTGDFPNLVVL